MTDTTSIDDLHPLETSLTSKEVKED